MIDDVCAKLLADDWMDSETQPGTASYKILSQIFVTFLTHGKDRLADALRDFLDVASSLTTPGSGEEAQSTKYRSLNRRSFPAFYEVLCSQLVRLAQTSPSLGRDGMLTLSQRQQQSQSRPMQQQQQQTAADKFLSQRHHIIPDGEQFGHREMLRAWDDLSVLFRDNVEMIRTFHNRSCYISVLKVFLLIFYILWRIICFFLLFSTAWSNILGNICEACHAPA